MIARARVKEPKIERGDFISFVDGVNKPVRVCPEYTEELVQHRYAMRCAEEWVAWIRPLMENQKFFNNKQQFVELNGFF